MSTTNTELIARLRLGASISRERKLNQGYDAVADEAADAIEALEASQERNTKYTLALQDDALKLQTEVERLTLERDVNKRMRDQHFAEVERLNAKIDEHTKLCVKRVAEVTRERNIAQAQLAAAQGQSLPILQVSAFVEGFLDEVEEPPEPNCRCHISPPCNDCVDHSSLRELFSDAHRLVKTISELKATPIPQQPDTALARLAELEKQFADAAKQQPSVPEGWKQAVALAYGHLWHVNNEPMAPIPLRSSETAAYEARKQLRDLLTREERGLAINQVQALLAAAPQPKETK